MFFNLIFLGVVILLYLGCPPCVSRVCEKGFLLCDFPTVFGEVLMTWARVRPAGIFAERPTYAKDYTAVVPGKLCLLAVQGTADGSAETSQ